MEDNIFAMMNSELVKSGYNNCDDNEKILLVQDVLRSYLIKTIIRKNKIVTENINSYDLNTLFMVISYSFNQEELNNIIFYMLNVISDMQKSKVFWSIDESKDDPVFEYNKEGKIDKLCSKKNYNSYNALCLVSNQLDEMKNEKKSTIAC